MFGFRWRSAIGLDLSGATIIPIYLYTALCVIHVRKLHFEAAHSVKQLLVTVIKKRGKSRCGKSRKIGITVLINKILKRQSTFLNSEDNPLYNMGK